MILKTRGPHAGRRDQAVARQEAPRPAQACIGAFALDPCSFRRKRAPCCSWIRMRRSEHTTTPPLKPARVALNVLAVCFALSVLGRGLGESFTVFLKPIRKFRLGPRADRLGLLAGRTCGRPGVAADRPAVRPFGTAHGLCARLALLGGGISDRRPCHQLWQFQLSLGLCVGIGIAFIGNVPNSILLGRWFGPRLPTAMAIVYSATGAGVLILLPASQVLIDHVGWRGAYQIFGAVALFLLLPLLLLPWRLFSTGSPHLSQDRRRRFGRRGLDLAGRDAPPRVLGACSRPLLHRDRMYAISPQVVAYLIDAGFPPCRRRPPGVSAVSCCYSACWASAGSTSSSAAGRRSC